MIGNVYGTTRQVGHCCRARAVSTRLSDNTSVVHWMVAAELVMFTTCTLLMTGSDDTMPVLLTPSVMKLERGRKACTLVRSQRRDLIGDRQKIPAGEDIDGDRMVGGQAGGVEGCGRVGYKSAPHSRGDGRIGWGKPEVGTDRVIQHAGLGQAIELPIVRIGLVKVKLTLVLSAATWAVMLCVNICCSVLPECVVPFASKVILVW